MSNLEFVSCLTRSWIHTCRTNGRVEGRFGKHTKSLSV